MNDLLKPDETVEFDQELYEKTRLEKHEIKEQGNSERL